MNRRWLRTCQECGFTTAYKSPESYVDKANKEPWRETLCKKCKSPSLDYGSEELTAEEKKKYKEQEEIGW